MAKTIFQLKKKYQWLAEHFIQFLYFACPTNTWKGVYFKNTKFLESLSFHPTWFNKINISGSSFRSVLKCQQRSNTLYIFPSIYTKSPLAGAVGIERKSLFGSFFPQNIKFAFIIILSQLL